jgi:hypothetical protein
MHNANCRSAGAGAVNTSVTLLAEELLLYFSEEEKVSHFSDGSKRRRVTEKKW